MKWYKGISFRMTLLITNIIFGLVCFAILGIQLLDFANSAFDATARIKLSQLTADIKQDISYEFDNVAQALSLQIIDLDLQPLYSAEFTNWSDGAIKNVTKLMSLILLESSSTIHSLSILTDQLNLVYVHSVGKKYGLDEFQFIKVSNSSIETMNDVLVDTGSGAWKLQPSSVASKAESPVNMTIGSHPLLRAAKQVALPSISTDSVVRMTTYIPQWVGYPPLTLGPDTNPDFIHIATFPMNSIAALPTTEIVIIFDEQFQIIYSNLPILDWYNARNLVRMKDSSNALLQNLYVWLYADTGLPLPLHYDFNINGSRYEIMVSPFTEMMNSTHKIMVAIPYSILGQTQSTLYTYTSITTFVLLAGETYLLWLILTHISRPIWQITTRLIEMRNANFRFTYKKTHNFSFINEIYLVQTKFLAVGKQFADLLVGLTRKKRYTTPQSVKFQDMEIEIAEEDANE